MCTESSCNSMAKTCNEAEMGEVIPNNLTETRQINYAVSAQEKERVALNLGFQLTTGMECKDKN